MSCFGCIGQDNELDKRRKSSRYSSNPNLSEGRSVRRKESALKTSLQIIEELSESTYGLAIEGKENKPYEAQDFFAFKEILGSGVVAVVFRAYFKPTGKVYAVKFISNLKQSRQFVSRELTILKLSCNCKYLVQYHSHFRVGTNMYFVIELCDGGTLEELLDHKFLMPPRLGRTYLRELASALMYLHSLKFVHRDVHVANCLLTSTAHLRLSDFGLTRTVDDPNGEMMTICGKAAIRAPELYLDKLCGFGLDWWSMGIMLYRFVTGYYPFQTEKLTQGFQSVTKLKEKYPEWLFDDPHTTDLCQKLLEKDPKQRLGYQNEAVEIKSHPYFSGMNWNVDENIENVLEQDLKTVSKQYIPVFKRILRILGAHNHPLLGVSEGTRDSDISITQMLARDLESRNIAKKLTDFLSLSAAPNSDILSKKNLASSMPGSGV
ncbi:unnamed protein product [Candidula unifasciata]|uniref:Protein kinase domain-containing protein n=1 Tax=Candidula unifasciata TaxID=100452 RepID=A0A8S3Z6L1_9EUPU|nr:unnamed protein product [Candidula unifasciata]